MFYVTLFLLLAWMVFLGVVVQHVMRKQAARRAELERAVEAFAGRTGGRLTERQFIDMRGLEVRATIAGHACEVDLGFEDGLQRLLLRAEVPGLDPQAFADHWFQRLIRYQRRGPEQAIRTGVYTSFMQSTGAASSFRDVFASELPRKEVATLFGAQEQGTQSAERTLTIQEGRVELRLREPMLVGRSRLEDKLATLVALGRHHSPAAYRPASKPSSERLRSAGKLVVTVQGQQRCPYCHEELTKSGVLRTCSACGAVLHSECLEEHGGCTTVGCRNRARRVTEG